MRAGGERVNLEPNPDRDELLDCGTGQLLLGVLRLGAMCFAAVLAGLFVGRTVAWLVEWLGHQ